MPETPISNSGWDKNLWANFSTVFFAPPPLPSQPISGGPHIVLLEVVGLLEAWNRSDLDRKVFSVSMTVNLLVGNLFRVLVFGLIAKTGGFANPVNFIIAVDEGVKMIAYSWNLSVIIASMELQTYPLVTYTGPTFCRATNVKLLI